jgi:hypothetical protein
MSNDKPDTGKLELLAERHIINDPPENIVNLAPLNPKELAKIKRQDRQHIFQLGTNAIAKLVAAAILLMAMYYTGTLIQDPNASVGCQALGFRSLGRDGRRGSRLFVRWG